MSIKLGSETMSDLVKEVEVFLKKFAPYHKLKRIKHLWFIKGRRTTFLSTPLGSIKTKKGAEIAKRRILQFFKRG
jgi:hypothetical protein